MLLPGPHSHNRWVRGLSRQNRDTERQHTITCHGTVSRYDSDISQRMS
jgi:hypothetical protein